MSKCHCGDLLELWKIIGRCGAGRPEGRICNGDIAGNATREDVDRIGAEARESVQLELHENGLACLLGRSRQSLGRDAKCPAPTIVLDADDALQRLLVDNRIVPSPDYRPVVLERPLPGEIHLLELRNVAARIDLRADETVARVEYAPGGRLPANAGVEAFDLRMVQVVFERAGSRPDVRETCLTRKQQIRGVGGARRLGQDHALALEIIALSDRKAHFLLT